MVAAMDVIYAWVKNIVIYMILNTIIMNLLGNSSYKKYVSIVSGMILVLIVISPLINVMELDKKFDYLLLSNNFSIETSDFKSDLNKMEEQQSDVVFTEYEDRLKTQVTEMLLEEGVYLTSFHLTIDQEVKNATFGYILGMDITAGLNKEKVNSDVIPSVDEIEINPINIKGQEEKAEINLLSPMEINIKKRLSDFYNIEPDNINISIQGG